MKTGGEISLGLPEHIETLFKVEPPIREIGKGAFGFSGVLLRDTKKDLVQCHICGEWFQQLTRHIQEKHKMNQFTYRKKFGLPLHFPLCNKRVSEQNRATLLATMIEKRKTGKWVKKKRDMVALRSKAISKEGMENFRYSTNNASWDNKHGACPDQLLKRYLVVADIVEGDPSKGDIENYDPPLYSMLRRRGYTLNQFREKHGFALRPASARVTESQILGAIRKIYKTDGRIPISSDFKVGSPSYHAIVRKFGSFRKALMVADVIE